MTAVLNVLLSKYALEAETEDSVEIPQRLIQTFGLCCQEQELINEEGFFDNPYQLVRFFCT